MPLSSKKLYAVWYPEVGKIYKYAWVKNFAIQCLPFILQRKLIQMEHDFACFALWLEHGKKEHSRTKHINKPGMH